jgi:hypothetical protein
VPAEAGVIDNDARTTELAVLLLSITFISVENFNRVSPFMLAKIKFIEIKGSC